MSRTWQAYAVVVIYLGLYVVLGYVGVVLVGWPSPRHTEAWQTWATVLAGAIVAWYTWETHELRRTAREQTDAALRQAELGRQQVDATLRQTEVQLRPFVVVLRGDHADTFIFENVGHGVALRIRAEDVEIEPTKPIRIHFPPLAILRPGEKRAVSCGTTSGGIELADPSFFAPHLDENYATLPLTLRLRYENVEGREYRGQQQSEPGFLDIAGPEVARPAR